MRTPKRAMSVAAIAVLLAMGLSACAQPAGPRTSSPQKTEPGSAAGTDTSGAESTAAPAGTQGEGDAWATVEAKCTICHTLDRVENARKDWKGWSSAVDHMVDNGAKLTPEERTAVVDYLASRSR